jgi:hypothetical protein
LFGKEYGNAVRGFVRCSLAGLSEYLFRSKNIAAPHERGFGHFGGGAIDEQRNTKFHVDGVWVSQDRIVVAARKAFATYSQTIGFRLLRRLAGGASRYVNGEGFPRLGYKLAIGFTDGTPMGFPHTNRDVEWRTGSFK